jgi:hypothetical protein
MNHVSCSIFINTGESQQHENGATKLSYNQIEGTQLIVKAELACVGAKQ